MPRSGFALAVVLFGAVVSVALATAVTPPTQAPTVPVVTGRRRLCSVRSGETCSSVKYCREWQLPAGASASSIFLTCNQWETKKTMKRLTHCKKFKNRNFEGGETPVCKKWGKCDEWTVATAEGAETVNCLTWAGSRKGTYSLFCVNRVAVLDAADGKKKNVCTKARFCKQKNAAGECAKWAGRAFRVGHRCAKAWAKADIHRRLSSEYYSNYKNAAARASRYKGAYKRRGAEVAKAKKSASVYLKKYQAENHKYVKAAHKVKQLSAQAAGFRTYAAGLRNMLIASLRAKRRFRSIVVSGETARAQRAYFAGVARNTMRNLKLRVKVAELKHRARLTKMRQEGPFLACQKGKKVRDDALAACQTAACASEARAAFITNGPCKDWKAVRLAEKQRYEKALARANGVAALLDKCRQARASTNRANRAKNCRFHWNKECQTRLRAARKACRPFWAYRRAPKALHNCKAKIGKKPCAQWHAALAAQKAREVTRDLRNRALAWAAKHRTWGSVCKARYATFKTAVKSCKDKVECYKTAKLGFVDDCAAPLGPGEAALLKKGKAAGAAKVKASSLVVAGLSGLCPATCAVFNNGCQECTCNKGFVDKACSKKCASPTEPKCVTRRGEKKKQAALLEVVPDDHLNRAKGTGAAATTAAAAAPTTAAAKPAAKLPNLPARSCLKAVRAQQSRTANVCANLKTSRGRRRCRTNLWMWRLSVCGLARARRECKAARAAAKTQNEKCAKMDGLDSSSCFKKATRILRRGCWGVRKPRKFEITRMTQRLCRKKNKCAGWLAVRLRWRGGAQLAAAKQCKKTTLTCATGQKLTNAQKFWGGVRRFWKHLDWRVHWSRAAAKKAAEARKAAKAAKAAAKPAATAAGAAANTAVCARSEADCVTFKGVAQAFRMQAGQTRSRQCGRNFEKDVLACAKGAADQNAGCVATAKSTAQQCAAKK